MPYSVCQKLGLTPTKTNKIVVELDKTKVNVVGMLDVFIQIASKP